MKNIKTKKKHGAGKAIAVVALSAIMLVGGGAVGYGAGTNWTYKRDTQSSSNYDDYQGGTILTPDEQNGIELAAKEIERKDFGKYGIAKTAENAYTLNASIEPVSASDKRVEWTVTCADAGVNVSEYITLSSEGLTAVLTCLKDFDKQFTVTVKSLDNPGVTASCTLDYVERITGVTVNMPKMTSEVAEATFEIESSKYTIQAEHNISFGNFQFNKAFDDRYGPEVMDAMYMRGEPISLFLDNVAEVEVNYTQNGVKFINGADYLSYFDFPNSFNFTSDDDVCFPEGFIGCFYAWDSQEFDSDFFGEMYDVFKSVMSENYIGTVDFTVSYSYNGKTYSSDKKTVELWVDGAAVRIPVTGITLPPNLVM